MKNLFKFIGAFILVAAFSFNSNAQTAVGGGITFLIPDGDSEIGINARGSFGLNENMEIAPGINYYLVDGITLMGFNADFHYLFGDEGSFRFYPLGGLNFMRASANGFSNSEFQFNVGAGGKYPLNDNMSLFGEGKYIIGDLDGIAITAGILFNIGG